MMRYECLEHRFVQHIPDKVEPGILYVSMEYGTAVHSCCCGCNEEVVTPFTPTDWKMIFDGETVSLHPSVGNWSLACRSHYVIQRDRIVEAGSWTDTQIEAERSRDRAAKALHYGATISGDDASDTISQSSMNHAPGGLWRRLWSWVRDR